MSESALAREFLDIVAALEKALERRATTKFRGLGQAVRELPSDTLVRRYRNDLEAFAGLRNAIAHNRYLDGRPIATPLPETVERARSVLAQFERPVLTLTHASTPMSFDLDQQLQPALSAMTSANVSQAPVTREGRYHCLLTTNAVARWLAAAIDTEGNVVMPDVRVRDVIDHLEAHERAAFIPRDCLASDAVDQLTGNNPPLALFITHNGRPEEAILKILVAADLPILLKALSS